MTDVVNTPDVVQSKIKREQMIERLKISLPPPRVKNFFRKELIRLTPYYESTVKNTSSTVVAGTTPLLTEEENVAAGTELDNKIRTSQNAYAALSIILSEILNNLIRHGMDNTIDENYKRVTVRLFLIQILRIFKVNH